MSAVAGKYVKLVVQKDCLKNGVTTLVVYVHNPTGHPKDIAEETAKGIIVVFGFRPTLSQPVITNIQGKPCYIFVVIGGEYENGTSRTKMYLFLLRKQDVIHG